MRTTQYYVQLYAWASSEVLPVPLEDFGELDGAVTVTAGQKGHGGLLVEEDISISLEDLGRRTLSSAIGLDRRTTG